MPSSSPTIAIVTGELAPQLSDGGRRLASALGERGIDCEPVRWDDTSVAWSTYDGVLVRSCWEYPDDVPRFETMLDELDRAGVPVCNPLPVLRWNLHKRYVTAIGDAGVQVPATELLGQGADVTLEAVLNERGWDDAVVKPAVGAMSSGVRRGSDVTAAESERRFADLLADGDVLVQRFVPEITDGERSAVFFDGEYSHAWNSLPVDGDVTEFDGIDAAYEPEPSVRRQAAAVVETACELMRRDTERLPYARIDYVVRGSSLLLMELELIEPYLGFERGDGAVERFRDVLVAHFEQRW